MSRGFAWASPAPVNRFFEAAMFKSLLLGVALSMGQTPPPPAAATPIPHPPAHAPTDGYHSCIHGHDCPPCRVTWLKPWTCEDLEMKPAEHKHRCCGFLHSLLWCPPEEEESKNGNGEKKNGAEEKKNGAEEKKEEAPEEEPEADRKPLMQLIYCRLPRAYNVMDCLGINAFGHIQGGFSTDFRRNINDMLFGNNLNERDTRPSLNQAYIVFEKALDLDKKKDMLHFGARVDFFAGHDAPDFENIALGFLENFTGNQLNLNTPYPGTPPPFGATFPDPDEFGISVPQFYVDTHLPILTDRGLDIRVGRFYTLMVGELSPAASTDFYSHSYEYYYSAPFTHFGTMTNLHIADTIDFYNGIVRGWDTVFTDYNDTPMYHGALGWTSCDKRKTLFTAWCVGPEPTFVSINQNQFWRTQISSYFTIKFGHYDEWRFVTGGNIAWQPGASANVNNGGVQEAAEWYGTNTYLFYTVCPKLILGSRFEWFRDDDGFRTGFPTSYLAGTLNATWKPWQNLRIRPEVRYDYSTQGSPFNAGTRRDQWVTGFDVIYEF